MLSFELYCGYGHLYHWRLHADERIICWSKGYRTWLEAKRDMQAFRKRPRLPDNEMHLLAELSDAPVKSVFDS